MRIVCNGQTFNLSPLGGAIDDAFLKMYAAYLGAGGFAWSEFHSAAHEFLDRPDLSPSDHNDYFNNIATLWNVFFTVGQLDRAEDLWRSALIPVLEWDNAHPDRPVHKGTAFYFWGATAIVRGDLDRGYSLMHQAVGEDIRTSGEDFPDTPATAVVTLNPEKPDQWFRWWVIQKATLLNQLLVDYAAHSGGQLDFRSLRAKFLSQPPNRDVVVLFAYVLARLVKVEEAPACALANAFFAQLGLNLLFDISLTVEVAIREKNPNQNHRTFIHHARFISNSAGLDLTQADLDSANQRFGADFAQTATDLLDGAYQLNSGAAPSPRSRDLLLTYGVRNRAAHHLGPIAVIGERFNEFRAALCNGFFFAVEHLY